LYYKTFFASLEDKFKWLATTSSVALPAVILGVISVVVAKVIARSILQAECLRQGNNFQTSRNTKQIMP